MSHTKRRVPCHWKHNPDNQQLSWIGIGTYHYEYPIRCPLANGRDRNQQSYINSAFVEDKFKGWAEQYRGKTKAFFKRKRAKHVRQYWKTQLERQDE